MYASPLKDKVPPHNLEAEQALLGALLIDWSALTKIIQIIRVDSFYSKRNAIIFEAMLSLDKKGQQGDTITLKDELTTLGKLEEAGGVLYLSELTGMVPTSANIEYYAGIVLDCSLRRELIKISYEVIAQSHDETKESSNVLEDAQTKILALTDVNQSQTIQPISDIVANTTKIIEERIKNHNAYTGIPSGITALDSLTSGFQDSELIIIGARPSMGKTALALTMIQHIAVEQKIPAAMFSLEMPSQLICMRLLAQISRTDSEKIRKGILRDADLFKIFQDAGTCYEAPLYIADSPSTKMFDIRGMSRRLVREHGVKIIFIDYISLISIDDRDKKLQRNEQVAEISRSLKSLARELKIPVVALSQLNRDTEKTRHKPTLADIRESGSIEQDADVVIFIHRDKEKQEENASEDKTRGLDTELILAKQRNGPIGTVKVLFFPTFTKFENPAHEHAS
jgi:replicative DNA helicase